MYCPPKAVALLWNRRFKALSPHQFNDPFEWDPPITGRASAAWLHKQCSQEHRRRQVYARQNLEISYEEFVKLDEQHGKASTKALHARQENVRAAVKKGLQTIRDRHKLICLSANPADGLCWAHYADKHRGFAIGIDSTKIDPLNLEKVRYSKARPSINLKKAFVANPAEKTEYWRKVFRTKSPEWKYEREFRWIFSHEDAIQSTDCEGNTAYFLPFEPSWVKEVVFGARCTNESEIRNAMMDPVFRRADRLRARLDERNFGIFIEPT
jgi:hypothetical protein